MQRIRTTPAHFPREEENASWESSIPTLSLYSWTPDIIMTNSVSVHTVSYTHLVKAGCDLPEFYQEIVEDELNVKNMKFTEDVRDFTSYSFKPQLKTVGPKYGKMLGGIKSALDRCV